MSGSVLGRKQRKHAQSLKTAGGIVNLLTMMSCNVCERFETLQYIAVHFFVKVVIMKRQAVHVLTARTNSNFKYCGMRE